MAVYSKNNMPIGQLRRGLVKSSEYLPLVMMAISQSGIFQRMIGLSYETVYPNEVIPFYG